MTNDVEFICHDCIGDGYLKGEICSRQDQHQCSFCGNEDLCIALPVLAERVHSVLDALELEVVARSDELEPDVQMTYSSRFPLSDARSEEALRTPTLRINLKSLRVFEVSHVSYSTTERIVSKYVPEQ